MVLEKAFCGDGKLKEEWKGHFDIATGSGVFLVNHIPPSGFDELVEVLKVGGIAVFCIRKDEWEG